MPLFAQLIQDPALTREDLAEMKRLIAEAEKNFAKLVNKVYVEGITVDLERDDKVIARLTPAEPRSPLTIGELKAFLRGLPSLGGDGEAFANDVRAIRAEFPAETSSWD